MRSAAAEVTRRRTSSNDPPSASCSENGIGGNARPHPGPTAIELSPSAGPHWQALNLNPNRNLARLRFLEIKSKITIKIGKKPFRLNSMAVRAGRGVPIWFMAHMRVQILEVPPTHEPAPSPHPS